MHVRHGGEVAESLGLFWVGHPTANSSTASLQVLHGLALVAIALSVHGALASRRSVGIDGGVGQVGSSELEEPILASPGTGLASQGVRRLRVTLLLYVADVLTPTMALGVCFVAVVSPMALALPLLLPAVLHFITREGNRLLEEVSPLATLFSSVWLVACFACAAVRPR